MPSILQQTLGTSEVGGYQNLGPCALSFFKVNLLNACMLCFHAFYIAVIHIIVFNKGAKYSLVPSYIHYFNFVAWV